MNDLYFELLEQSENLCFDTAQKEKLNSNIANWKKNYDNSIKQFSNLNLAKDKVISIVDKSLYNLENLIFDFETNFIKGGGKVGFAQNEKDANELINRILKDSKSKKVIVNSGIVMNELGVKDAITKKGAECSELNIDNIIANVKKKKNVSEHLTFPATNYNKEDIIQMMSNTYETDENMTIPELIRYIEKDNNVKIKESDTMISGVNFLVSETGSIVCADNEGAFLKSQLKIKTRIFVAAIDQIISNFSDLDVLLPIYSTYANGQQMSSENVIISGLDTKGEHIADELYVIIVNNKRVQALEDASKRTLLRCIGCGACLNVCPIYCCSTGGLYNNQYPGPLGLIFNPEVKSMITYGYLPYLCTLCGKCSEVCPVKIDFPSLIIQMRRQIVDGQFSTLDDENLMSEYYKRVIKRKKMDKRSIFGFKNKHLKRMLAGMWGEWKIVPEFEKNSFSEQYVAMHLKDGQQNNK